MDPLTSSRSLGLVRITALAICLGFGLAFVIANLRSWQLEDSEAYWSAALRVRSGAPLYVPVTDPDADALLAYRYAPWFAWVWVPLTYLPKSIVQAGWSVVLVASAGIAILPLLRVRSVAGICLAALLGGLLIKTASTGNVHAVLVAVLVLAFQRKSGPIWIGVAASLKFVPLLYALVYLGRREWRRAGVALFVAAVLLAPALLEDLRGYPADPGASLSLLSLAGPIPWAALALAAAGLALALARSPYAWAAASVAVLAAVPRLELYDLSYLLVGLGKGYRDA